MKLRDKIKTLLAFAEDADRFAESAKALTARLDSVEEQVRAINDALSDVHKLVDLVNKRELATSEFELFKTETAAQTFASVEAVQEEIDHLHALKVSYDASPAIGGRMLRNKNSQIVEVNRKLQELIATKARMRNEQN